jgi:14-3-3 protein epsilon
MADQLKWLNTAILDELVPKKKDPNAYKIPDSHEDLQFMAKLTEQAERYDEMVLCMRKIVKLNSELSQDERNLLAVAYKNVISSRRAAWRVIIATEQQENERQGQPGNAPSDNLPIIVMLRRQFEQELAAACEDLLGLLDTFLIPGAQGGEPKVFYLKMKGDYHRYYAETAAGDQQKALALDAYEKAMVVANASLAPTHPTRLGLVLNLSVFHYEIMKNRETGFNLARTAYDEASSELDALEDEPYREAALIVQLLRDNINLWNEDNNTGGAQQQ